MKKLATDGDNILIYFTPLEPKFKKLIKNGITTYYQSGKKIGFQTWTTKDKLKTL